MKLIVALIFLQSLMCSYAVDEVPKTVKVGAFHYYPAIFKDHNGKVSGFFPDLLYRIGLEQGINFEFAYGSWEEGLESIQRGDIDLLTSVAYTKKRDNVLDFSKDSLLTVWGELYVCDDLKVQTIYDLRNKRIGVMKKDFNGMKFKELMEKFGVDVHYVEFTGFEDIFKALESHYIDGGVVNSNFGASKANEYEIAKSNIVFSPFQIYFAVAETKNKELLNILNDYLKRWKKEKDSFYYKRMDYWLNRRVDIHHVIPSEIYVTGIFVVLLLIGLTIFSISLKRKVNRATETIEEMMDFESRVLRWAPYGIIETDLGFNIKIFNPAAEKFLYYDSIEVVNEMEVFSFMKEKNPNERPSKESYEEFIRHKLEQEGHIQFSCQFKKRDGEEFTACVSMSVIKNAHHEPNGYLIMFRELCETGDVIEEQSDT